MNSTRYESNIVAMHRLYTAVVVVVACLLCKLCLGNAAVLTWNTVPVVGEAPPARQQFGFGHDR